MRYKLNPIQKQIIKILKKEPDGMTIPEMKAKYGIEVSVGQLNGLLRREGGLINIGEKIVDGKRIRTFSWW